MAGESSLFPELELDSGAGRTRAPRAAKKTGDRPASAPPAGPCVDVALARPVRREFTYTIAAADAGRSVPGMRVLVPFGPRREVGVVVAVHAAPPAGARGLRGVLECLDEAPVVDGPLLALTRWMAEEYGCAWGEALAAVLPAPLKRLAGERRVLCARVLAPPPPEAFAELETRAPKQHRLLRTLLEIEGTVELRPLLKKLRLTDQPARALAEKGLIALEHAPTRDPLAGAVDGDRRRPERLSDDQAFAIDLLRMALLAGRGRSFLLQGVTGSGKTEVYLRAIELALERGRGAIVLVPEIALTPQTVGWFRSRFGEIAVLHSGLSDAQRLRTWRRVRDGELRVVVGARSAVFAPVRDLGLIVLDEEHEPSFKQASSPRYHARDVALERAAREGALCLLGSATPSLESFEAARAGRHVHLILASRVGAGRLPDVQLIDLRTEPPGPEGGLFSRALRTSLEQTVARGEQAILFLNRRGHTPVLWCAKCRTAVRCEQCSAAMTLHRRIGRLVCHLCAAECPVPRDCPSCTAPGLGLLGAGSERVEAALRRLLPSARIRRMDSDTMHRREDYDEVLGAFGRGELDVLVGTQMIAKGLDFPRVTLVGIVSADTSLHLPDFRAAERTFQLVAQVAGRAGRGELAGRILVQTASPEHPAIALAARHDFDAFAVAELELRRQLGYPPFGRVARVVLEDEDGALVARAATALGNALAADLAADPKARGVELLGPAPAPLEKVRGRYRHHLLLKAPREGPALAAARTHLLTHLDALPTRPRAHLDIDPAGLL